MQSLQSDISSQKSSQCASCNVQDLREWFLPTIHNETSALSTARRDSLDWISILSRKQCQLCRLIVRTLCQADGFIEAVSGPKPAKVRIVTRNVGRVVWRPGEDERSDFERFKTDAPSGWHWNDGDLVRCVRQIVVTSELNGRYWQGWIQAFGKEIDIERNKLLLGRQIPSHIDFKQIKFWQRLCQDLHGNTCCSQPWDDICLCGVRMIDVVDCCVVAAPSKCQYLALSYCWGPPELTTHLKLTGHNLKQLSTLAALSEDKTYVPSTIKHAIHLTEKLGYRYLWVDALCIVQDDEKNKASQIHQMDRIYKSAVITIAAATGDNAWSGLAGVYHGSRLHVQIIEQNNRLSLATATKGYIENMETCEWSRRAWVLQERNLSSRLLVFTPRQIFWECNNSVWCEETLFEFSNPRVHLEVERSLERFKKPPLGLSPAQRYGFLLSQYTTRKLTQESDALHAVQGLLNDMMVDFPEGFHWGLPESIFDTALLWHFGAYQQAPKPRRPDFPSWSWTAWKSAVAHSIGGPTDAGFQGQTHSSGPFKGGPIDASSLRSEVAWFRIREDSRAWIEINNVWISRQDSIFQTESVARWKTQNSNLVLQQVIELLNSNGIPHSHALAFWTQSVLLDVDHVRHPNNTCAMAVRDCHGNDIGHIDMTTEWRESRPDQLPFILIGRDTKWKTPFFDLMCVEWAGAIASRVQLIRNATITNEVWKSLSAEWRFVILV